MVADVVTLLRGVYNKPCGNVNELVVKLRVVAGDMAGAR
jgi:hypothetical protein